jgi:6-phosphogluconolactonase
MEKGARRFEFQSFATDEELAEAAAVRFATRVMAARDESRFIGIALSGGRIAAKFFAAVAKRLSGRGGMGGTVHFFWADERCVGPEAGESNYRLANELFLGPLGVPLAQVHRIRGELEPGAAAEKAAREYAGVMATYGAESARLDLALLGMGEDGHIASLFPGEPAGMTGDAAIFRAVVAPKPPPDRVTMGYRTLAAAGEVWVMVSGCGKEAALEESLRPAGRTPLGRLLGMQVNAHVLSSVRLPGGKG